MRWNRITLFAAAVVVCLGRLPVMGQHHHHHHGGIGLHWGSHFGHLHGHLGLGYTGYRLHYGYHLGRYGCRYYYPAYPRCGVIGWGVGYYPLYPTYYTPWYAGCAIPYYPSGIYFRSTVISPLAPLWLGRVDRGAGRAVAAARPQIADAGGPAANNADALAMIDFLKAHEQGRRKVAQVDGRNVEQGDLVAELARRIDRRAKAERAARRSEQAQGDAAFRAGDYAGALRHYDRSLRVDPKVATWLRKSFALAALARYDEAAESLRKAADHGGTRLSREDCPLDTIFADENAKMKQLDRIAQAALQDPDNADRLLLVGAFLLFDGQPERARKFFDRAAIVGPHEQLAVAQTLKHVR